MKKIINGKLYDTETAKEVGLRAHGSDPRDFHYFVERLYRKRTGEYFLHGEGGPMTQYARTIGQNQWSGGEKIMPLDYQAAREWAEKHMDADDYMEEFGPVSEDGNGERTVLTISLDVATAERIRRAAKEAGMSVSALIASKF